MSGSKISLSLGGSRRAPPPTNGVKRPRAALQEEDEEGTSFGKAETVSHFDRTAGGAIDERKKKQEEGPLIIPRMANRDWKEAANKRKRQKSSLPGEGRDVNMDQKMADVEAADAAKKPGFGLNIYKREDGVEGPSKNRSTVAERLEDTEEADQDTTEPAQPRTDDDVAMDALLGKTNVNRDLIIAQTESISETDAFRHDAENAPDMASLDDYARVPVEDFGAAMLRGMGWKEGEGIGSQKGKKIPKATGKLPERRANLLGIGAKEDAALAQEMGAWGKGARGGKEVKIYNPVLLKDKTTGRLYTEEELQQKREKDEREKYEKEFEAKETDRERKRRKDDEDDRDSRDRRRDRDRDGKRDRDRRKHDEDSDDEYYRQKEREKERKRRREREERDGDYDRQRSRRHRDRDDGDRHRNRDQRDREKDRRR